MHRRPLVIVLGLAASAVFMFLAARRLDIHELVPILRHTTIMPWIPLGIASYLAGHLVRGVRCRLLVAEQASLPVPTAANVVVVGYAANNVFPTRLGELVRAGMLSERTGIPIVQSLTVTFIERVLDGLAILALLALGVGALGSEVPAWAHHLARIASLVFGVATLGLAVTIYAPGAVVAAGSRLGNRLPARWHDRMVRFATSVTNGGACLKRPRAAALLVLYSLVVWSLETGLFVSVLGAFGFDPNVALGAVAMSVTNLGLLLPSSPGFIGPFHYFCSRAVMMHGIDESSAFAYATVVHLAFYVPVTIWGAIAMAWYGVEVGATAAITRAARQPQRTAYLRGLTLHEIAPLPAPAKPESASAFTRSIVEAIVAPEGEPAHADALNESVEFVHRQLDALHPRLKLLFRVGMLGFRLLTRVRYLRGFSDLSLETRRAWTRAWLNAPFALARRLLKPVQATALLAYYDHATRGGRVRT
jgi:uncharacterized protein (TIRG00374 family)